MKEVELIEEEEVLEKRKIVMILGDEVRMSGEERDQLTVVL